MSNGLVVALYICPSNLSGNPLSFREAFFDCGGLIAEVLESGPIKIDDPVIPPPRGY
jgi:hypothetical protein